MFQDWLDLLKKIQAMPSSQALHCPECGNDRVDYQYVGDIKARKGYLDIWCWHCHKGVHLSRVTIPANAEVICFDAPDDVLSARIPDFTQMVPEEPRE